MAHITFQQKFCPPLPEIDGSKDYRDKRELYERMDQLITDLGLDTQFARLALKDHQKPSERKKDWMITAYRIQKKWTPFFDQLCLIYSYDRSL